MSIARNIRHIRESKGMTLEMLSAKTGLAIATCVQIEAGVKAVSGDELVAICDALEVAPEDIQATTNDEDSQSSVLMPMNDLQALLKKMKE